MVEIIELFGGLITNYNVLLNSTRTNYCIQMVRSDSGFTSLTLMSTLRQKSEDRLVINFDLSTRPQAACKNLFLCGKASSSSLASMRLARDLYLSQPESLDSGVWTLGANGPRQVSAVWELSQRRGEAIEHAHLLMN